MKPYWMRNHVACPECGHIYNGGAALAEVATFSKDGKPVAYDCPKCKAHFTDADFWRDNQEKWNAAHQQEEARAREAAVPTAEGKGVS